MHIFSLFTPSTCFAVFLVLPPCSLTHVSGTLRYWGRGLKEREWQQRADGGHCDDWQGCIHKISQPVNYSWSHHDFINWLSPDTQSYQCVCVSVPKFGVFWMTACVSWPWKVKCQPEIAEITEQNEFLQQDIATYLIHISIFYFFKKKTLFVCLM